MGNIVQAQVSITGVRPLMWHVFGPDALPLEKKERTGVAGNDPEEWKRTVTYDRETRQLYFDSAYIFACIRDASRHTKKGKGSIQALVSATLQVAQDRVMVDRFLPEETDITTDPAQPVYIDVRGCRNPATKARNVRYRVAAKAGWNMVFTIEWDKTIVSRPEMNAVLLDAGRLTGLADGRSVGFGRFQVDSFTMTEE